MKKKMKEHEAIKFLLDNGLLFEINRSVLHPFGLALSVIIDDEENCKFDGLLDCRDDPEGIVFSDEVLAAGQKKYRDYLEKEGFNKEMFRYDKLGYICQQKYSEEIIIKNPQECMEKLFGENPKAPTEQPPEEPPDKQPSK